MTLDSDRKTLEGIKHYEGMEKEWTQRRLELEKRLVLPSTATDDDAYHAIVRLDRFYQEAIEAVDTLLREKFRFDAVNVEPLPSFYEEGFMVDEDLFYTLLVDSLLLNGSSKALRTTTAETAGTFKEVYRAVNEAIAKALEDTVTKLVFDMACAETDDVLKDVCPDFQGKYTAAYEFLTGWIASQPQTSWVRTLISRQQPKNLDNEVLRELHSSVWQKEPDKMSSEEFAELPSKTRGDAAFTNRAVTEFWKDLEPTTQKRIKDEYGPQPDKTEEWLEAFVDREDLYSLMKETDLNNQERQYFTLVLENPDLFFYGGNTDVAKRLGWKPGHVANIKSTTVAKLLATYNNRDKDM